MWVIGLSFTLLAQKSAQVSSPDGLIFFKLELTGMSPVFIVNYKKKALVNKSELTLDFENGAWGQNLMMKKISMNNVDEFYDLVVGKAKHIRNYCHEMIVPFEETIKPFRKINLVVRAYNDGVAFRYEFPKQVNWNNYILYDEKSCFNMAGDPKALMLFLPSYTTSHEGVYTLLNCSEIEPGKLMDMPATLECPNNVFMAITEAQLVDYAGISRK